MRSRFATARQLTGEAGKVICVVGDGALTGGMAYEALNNIGQLKPEMVIILNDNGRSYAPTVGGIAENLGHLRLSPRYEAAKDAAGVALRSLPAVGHSAYETARRMKNSLKQLVAPISIFETLGLKYGGPIDGHDLQAVEKALRDAARIRGPVVVHVVTNKGQGYGPAVADKIDKFHAVSIFDPDSGTTAKKAPDWTDVFGEALCEAAEADPTIVAITAAMASSTGLLDFAQRFPDRFFDVGIAEQHAVTFAAGLAMRGLRPVVCIYSTFLQRAFDQIACDVALHQLPGDVRDRSRRHHRRRRTVAPRHARSRVSALHPRDDRLGAELARRAAPPVRHRASRSDGPFSLRFPRGAAPGAGTAPLDPIPMPSIEIRHRGRRCRAACRRQDGRGRDAGAGEARAVEGSPRPWSTRASSSRSTRR